MGKVTIGETLEAMEILADVWEEGESCFSGHFIPKSLYDFETGLFNHMRTMGITYVYQYKHIYDDYPSIKNLK